MEMNYLFMFDINKIREDFPILKREIEPGKPLIYFDNTATTQKPLVVIDALVEYYSKYNANIHRGIHKLAEEATNAYEKVRQKVKSFLNVSDEYEVIFTRNATESLNLLAYSLGELLNHDDEVVVSEMEHHSNIIPWHMLNSRKTVNLKFAPITKDYELDYAELEKLITQKTKIVSVAHKSNVLSTVNDISRISKLTKMNNSIFIVDGAQSMPHLPFNFSELNCDFFVFSSHKMCGPTGVGVLIGKKDLLNKMPPFLGGGEMIDTVNKNGFTCNDLPWKYEAGTPNIADVIGFGVALDYLSKIGLDNIYRHEKELTEYFVDRLSNYDDIKIFTHKDGAGLVTFSHNSIHPNDLSMFLNNYGIAVRAGNHCAQVLHEVLGVTATLRASFYFYNTKEEIDIFFKAFDKSLKMLLLDRSFC